MKVAEYRDLISGVTLALASLKSSATSRERFNEGWVLLRAMKELVEADCPRKSVKDEQRANNWLKAADEYLMTTNIRQLVEQQNRADVNLTRMAFAGEYR